jgi:hypothetical protein
MIGTTNSGIEADGKAQLFFENAAGEEVDGPAKTEYIANEALVLDPIYKLMVRYDPRYSFQVSTTSNMLVAWEGRAIAYPYSGVTETAGTKTIEVYGPSAYPLKFTISVLVYDFDNAPVIASPSAALHNYGERLNATFTVTTGTNGDTGKNTSLDVDGLTTGTGLTWQWYKNNEPFGDPIPGDLGKVLDSAAKKGTYKVGVKAKGFREKFSNEISNLGTTFSTVPKLADYLDDDTWTTSPSAPESVQLKILSGTSGPVADDVLSAIVEGEKYISLDLSVSTAYDSLSSRFFEDCDWLVGINLGKNITSVEQRVFYKCDNLTTIIVDPENPNLELDNNSLYTISPKELVYYMSKATAGTLVIPTGVETILPYAVTFNDNIKFLEVRAVDVLIGNFAFWNLPNLEKVTFYPVVANPNDNAVLRNNAVTWFGDLQEKIIAGGGKGIYVRTDSSSGNNSSYVWKKDSSL